MINKFINFFKNKDTNQSGGYNGLSDFFQHAPADEQKRVFTEAARRANDDQMKVFQQAKSKTSAN